MSNNTFHRLWNEWNVNAGVNPVLAEYVKAHSIDIYDMLLSTDTIKKARDYCRKVGLWWRDDEECNAWLAA